MKATGRPLRVGVSACLLGQEVRWDGGHRRDRWITDVLGPEVEFVPFCPEMEIGLGAPRPTIRIEEGAGGGARLVEPRSRGDLTARMERYAARRVRALGKERLAGCILKKDSPSCGPGGVKVHDEGGNVLRRDGRGLFAAALRARFPLLPVEDEGRLADPRVRERFVERLHAWRRLDDLLSGGWTAASLARFHAAEEPLLRARDPARCRDLARVVAGAARRPRAAVAREYREGYMGALGDPPAPRRGAGRSRP